MIDSQDTPYVCPYSSPISVDDTFKYLDEILYNVRFAKFTKIHDIKIVE